MHYPCPDKKQYLYSNITTALPHSECCQHLPKWDQLRVQRWQIVDQSERRNYFFFFHFGQFIITVNKRLNQTSESSRLLWSSFMTYKLTSIRIGPANDEGRVKITGRNKLI